MQTESGLFNLAGWEIVLILALILLLIGARKLPALFEGLRKGVQGFTKATNEVMTTEIQETLNPNEPQERDKQSHNLSASLVLWVAQGFGIGRIPWAPGTFGSLVGLVWFAALLAGGSFWLYLIGSIVGIAVSVRFCGLAELILREEDPSSVVLDEIIAIPICFASWVGIVYFKNGGVMPGPEFFFTSQALPMTAVVYVLFRLFDIAKPSPVRQSQSLPGGWGVTVDDVLAAVYVNVVVLGIHIANVVLTHKTG